MAHTENLWQATIARAVGANALGALAIGACAIVALAIGRLVVGRLVIDRASLKSLSIDELTVTRLKVRELTVTDSLVGPNDHLPARLPKSAHDDLSPGRSSLCESGHKHPGANCRRADVLEDSLSVVAQQDEFGNFAGSWSISSELSRMAG